MKVITNRTNLTFSNSKSVLAISYRICSNLLFRKHHVTDIHLILYSLKGRPQPEACFVLHMPPRIFNISV